MKRTTALTVLVGYDSVLRNYEGYRYALNVFRGPDGKVRRLTVAPISKGRVKLRRDDGGSEWLAIGLVFGEISPSKEGPKRIRRALGFPGYFVGDTGVVFGTRGGVRVLRPFRVNSKRPRYYAVKLRVGGKYRNVYVHRLVWESFRGKIPPGMMVRHRDDRRPRDNRLSELAIGTRRENVDDALKGGRYAQKLTPKAVRVVRELVAKGWTQRAVARIFDVGETTVSDIVRRKIWAHVA
jgi:hypothetical protein